MEILFFCMTTPMDVSYVKVEEASARRGQKSQWNNCCLFLCCVNFFSLELLGIDISASISYCHLE